MMLVGDVGGTKTVVALTERDGDAPRTVREATYRSRDWASLEDLVADFVGGSRPHLDASCFGVAGPVMDGRVRVTNLPWVVDAERLREAAGVKRLALLNDVEATAYGMLFLGDHEFETLQRGSRPRFQGHVGVIAVGTGLGEALLAFDGAGHRPLPSEGGHADFAPRTEQEFALLRFLRAELGGRVSLERVLSGMALPDVYRFLRRESGASEPAWLAERLAAGDRSAAIAQAGLAGEDPVCAETLRLVVGVYGAEAGNLALRSVTCGGVLVGGGVAPKLLPALRSGVFMEAFLDKGRLRPFLEALEVSVALNSNTALLGCAHYALRL
jgi:glucokinase